MAGTRLRFVPVWLGVLVWIGWAGPALACPFCSMQGQTLTGDVNQASMVLFGTLTNARLNPNGGFGQGATDLKIEEVLKKNDILGEKKVITLPRYVPTDNNKTKFLIFCDVFQGKIDPYRGVPVKADSDMVKYLKGALAVKDKDISTRLRFFFDYLDNPDLEISNDAYKEFANASYNDYHDMAKKLPAHRIAKWLQDPETPSFRFGLYASMLGHCGTEKDAALLRKLLDDPEKRMNSGVDGMLAGYTLLKPKEGWEYIKGILKDPKKEFMLRYAALRAVRFFHDSRPDVIGKKELVEGVCLLLDQSDVADLAIEDLRKWGYWAAAGRILGLSDKKSHDVPIVRRAILRYALSCPDKKAAAFVATMRQKDAETVKDVEELLKLETTQPAAPLAGAKK
jgi:hypothetical protein